MKNKNKLLMLFSIPLLSLLIGSSISNKYSNFNSLNIKDKEVIVYFNDGYSLSDFNNELNKLTDNKNNYLIKDVYEGIVNGVLLDVNYSLLSSIESFNSVSGVYENRTYYVNSLNNENTTYIPNKVYNTPLENNSLEEMNTPKDSNGGEGTLIAVLDSSFNLDHKAFKDLSSNVEVKLTENDVKKVVTSLDAQNQTDFYHNRKIPFYHDYGGAISNPNTLDRTEDDDVNTANSYHGMHVSSIASANGDFTGVAPNSQLAFMKVFGDYQTEQICVDSMILPALNDCYKLGVDVINMSLGLGINEFETESASYKAIEKLIENGVTVSVSAGNDGKGNWKTGSTYSYDTLETLEEGTIGTYNNAPGVIRVASLNVKDDDSVYAELSVNGVTLSGKDQLGARGDLDRDDKDDNIYGIMPFTSLIKEGEETSLYEYVIVPGVGSINDKNAETGEELGDDYEDIDVKGKIAVVKRGENTFIEKIKHAKEKGAVGIIIANQEGLGPIGTFNMKGSKPDELIPAYSISAEDYDTLSNASEKVISIARSSISDFSTNGVTADLGMKIEISAPGQNIAGAINVDNDVKTNSSYVYISGTSMASPNYAGAVSLILGEQDFRNETEELEFKKTIKARAMSTANVLYQANGAAISPRKQGAGLVDITNATTSSFYLTGESEEINSGAKVELKNNEDIMNGKIDFDVNIHNEEGLKGSYDAKLLVQVPETKLADGEVSPEFKGKTFKTSNDVLIEKVNFEVELNGSKEQVVNIFYELNEETKNELNNTFANGTYIEGFVLFEDETRKLPDLSIPYLGFFGDYSKGDAVEDFKFEREEGKVYQSDLLNEASKKTLGKPNANFSSMIGVTTGGLDGIDMERIRTNSQDPGKAFLPIICEYNNEDQKYHLYAGAIGSADTLYIQQFVNRQVLDNTITLTNSEGEVVLTDHMFSLLHSSGSDYKLWKTIPTGELYINADTLADRAYTIIPLKDEKNKSYYPDGEYSLKFEYQLLSGYTQVKEYVLHISETTEDIGVNSVNFDGEELILYFDKEMALVSVEGINISGTLTDKNLYEYKFNIKENKLDFNNDIYIHAIDRSYNQVNGVIAREGNSILWNKNIVKGYSFSLNNLGNNDLNVPNATKYSVSLYGPNGNKVPFVGNSYITLFGDYKNSQAKCYGDTILGEAILKELDSVKTDTSLTISLENSDTFIVSDNVISNINIITIVSIIIAVVLVLLIVVTLTIIILKKHKNKTE